jgi:hypothetical protein
MPPVFLGRALIERLVRDGNKGEDMAENIDLFMAASTFSDSEVRRYGIGFIGGTIPGYALVMVPML